MAKKNDKRIRLIEAAQQLFKEKGFSSTTLAMIAERGNVPLGNVYYYFKSKESILTAVLDNFFVQMQDTHAKYNEIHGQRERLKAFVTDIASNAAELSRYGHPLMSLARDTMDESQEAKNKLAEMMKFQHRWMIQQFLALNSDPQTYSQLFLQRVYGIISVSMMLGEDQYIKDHCQRLLSELDS